MKLFRRPQCPYCGARLNYAKAWVLKTRGEYICPKCGGLSNVRQNAATYRIAFVVITLSTIFFIIGLVGGTNLALITLPAILILFLIFFLLSPLLVRLLQPNNGGQNREQSSVRRAVPTSENRGQGVGTSVSGYSRERENNKRNAYRSSEIPRHYSH